MKKIKFFLLCLLLLIPLAQSKYELLPDECVNFYDISNDTIKVCAPPVNPCIVNVTLNCPKIPSYPKMECPDCNPSYNLTCYSNFTQKSLIPRKIDFGNINLPDLKGMESSTLLIIISTSLVLILLFKNRNKIRAFLKRKKPQERNMEEPKEVDFKLPKKRFRFFRK